MRSSSSGPAPNAAASRFERLVKLLHLGDDVLSERADDLGVVEQTVSLLGRRPIPDVWILEDLCEGAASPMLADHVGREPVELVGPREERRERVAEDLREATHSKAMLQPRAVQSAA